MLTRVLHFFWPTLKEEELKKFGLLSTTFFFTIGTYWLLRPVKDGLFSDYVGLSMQPTAKMLSVLVVLALVLIYSKLVDMVERHKLFYIVGTFYAIFFTIIAFMVGSNIFSQNVLYYVGWATYFGIESFGSIIVALFWSFVASMTDAETAKRGFPIIITGAQLGAIAGPAIAFFAETIGLPVIFMLCVAGVLMIMHSISKFMKEMPPVELVGTQDDEKAEKSKKKTGFLEGLTLLLTRPYLFGIFLVVLLYEAVSTIIDYQMKVQAKALPEYASKEALTKFLGLFGMSCNTLAFLMALLGTTYLMKRFGLVFCLLTFPIVLGGAIIALYNFGITGNVDPRTLLWMTFGVMIIAKGLSYALNNPAKEMMYIPTSRDAKFKTKGWIDMFGGRSAKALGSAFNNTFKHNIPLLLNMGTMIALGLTGVWIIVALLVGRKFVSLTKSGKIVE